VYRNLFAAALFVAAFAGCSPSYQDRLELKPIPAKGKISLKGKPLPHAIVTFHPVEKLGTPSSGDLVRTPFGVAKEDGSFELTTFKPADGAPEGEYAVTISWTGGPIRSDNDAAPERLPPQYQNPVASGIRVQVRAGQELPEIRLN